MNQSDCAKSFNHLDRQGQGIENGSWMGIPAWQWPKTHGQGNKGVAQEEAH